MMIYVIYLQPGTGVVTAAPTPCHHLARTPVWPGPPSSQLAKVHPPKAAGDKRKRTKFNDAADAFFQGALAQWQRTRGVLRTDTYKQMLQDAQAPGAINQLESANWTMQDAIKTEMEDRGKSPTPPDLPAAA